MIHSLAQIAHVCYISDNDMKTKHLSYLSPSLRSERRKLRCTLSIVSPPDPATTTHVENGHGHQNIRRSPNYGIYSLVTHPCMPQMWNGAGAGRGRTGARRSEADRRARIASQDTDGQGDRGRYVPFFTLRTYVDFFVSHEARPTDIP